MEANIKSMLKSIIIGDVILAVLICAFSLVVKSSYVVIALLGLLVAALNFTANSILTDFVYIKKKKCDKIFLLIGGIIRVAIICVIAIILCKINKFYIIAYIVGFTAQYISIIIYGLKVKNA
ncbi:ATP synthase subunit I [Clostridium neuense]|uniref:ATP synthase subunit I n=1 Tax=Clostridium neuense TaxID=1728934 RepID=A0ABW8TDA2_9CLOT